MLIREHLIPSISWIPLHYVPKLASSDAAPHGMVETTQAHSTRST